MSEFSSEPETGEFITEEEVKFKLYFKVLKVGRKVYLTQYSKYGQQTEKPIIMADNDSYYTRVDCHDTDLN